MEFIASVVFGLTSIQLLVALANLLFWQRIPKSRTGFNGLVSVLIPARNEEENIGNLLTDLHRQDYQDIEILVFDDCSTDRTPEIITGFSKYDKRIRLIPSQGLPEGWLGKNHACHSLAKQASGEYFLFLDADVRISNDIIAKTICFSEKHELGLLSVFPRQIMKTPGEQITVPVMNFVLLSILPLILVRKSKYPSLSAAIGQFMLFNAGEYRDRFPHEKMKSEKVEDIAIARFYKQNQIRIACLTGDDTIACRMYKGFLEAVNGFSKNVIHFFGHSYILALLFWLITTFGFLVVLVGLPGPVFIVYLAIIVITRIVISIISRQNVGLNILFLIPQQCSLGLFILKAILNHSKNQYLWKGRTIF